MHEFHDPDGTGRCQARPVYLAIPGAVERTCELPASEHRCPTCGHKVHNNFQVCGHMTTRDIKADGRGFPPGYTPPSRNILESVCYCTHYTITIYAQCVAKLGDPQEHITYLRGRYALWRHQRFVRDTYNHLAAILDLPDMF